MCALGLQFSGIAAVRSSYTRPLPSAEGMWVLVPAGRTRRMGRNLKSMGRVGTPANPVDLPHNSTRSDGRNHHGRPDPDF